MLSTSKPATTAIDPVSEITFGNKNALLEIVVVTNPFCGHCKEAHGIVEDILKKHSDKVKIIIRFNIRIEDLAQLQVTSKLTQLFHQQNPKTCLDAMHDIYNGMDINSWKNKWGNSESSDIYLNTLNIQKEWCISNGINFTPALLINGKLFPKAYDRADLIYFIEELHDNCCVKNKHMELIV